MKDFIKVLSIRPDLAPKEIVVRYGGLEGQFRYEKLIGGRKGRVLKAISILSLSIVIVLTVILGAMTAVSIATDEKWAVILSPGPEAGVPWGGYHVTVTGYSDQHTCRWDWGETIVCGDLAYLTKILSYYYHDDEVFGGKAWHVHGQLPNLDKWNGIWTQTFASDMLDTLAQELDHESFNQLKGPDHAKKFNKHTGQDEPIPWHISLTEHKGESQDLVHHFKDGKVDWYLWLVPGPPSDNCQQHGTDCPLKRWQQIK